MICHWCAQERECKPFLRFVVCDECRPIMEKHLHGGGHTTGKTQSRWRNMALEVITKVMNDNPTAGPAELRKLLRAAYPFGQRKYHPYKIWCEEQRNAIETRM